MRALSIRQPHAEAIMRSVKKIEYRSVSALASEGESTFTPAWGDIRLPTKLR